MPKNDDVGDDDDGDGYGDGDCVTTLCIEGISPIHFVSLPQQLVSFPQHISHFPNKFVSRVTLPKKWA